MLSSYLATLAVSIGCLYCSQAIHTRLLYSVIRWPMELFDTTPLGRVVNRFAKDIDSVDNILPQNWRSVMTTGYSVINSLMKNAAFGCKLI